MLPAAKDTFGRVCKEDGTYHYPKTVNNIRRKKNQLYFTPMEVTRSNDGTKKHPKFRLLRYFKDTEIPRLEQICQQVQQQANKKPIIRYQMDGAGPHRDQALLDYLNAQFDSCGWMLVFQPNQSPLTNTKDACIFPAMSKEVTAEQGLSHGSHVLEAEELWRVVEHCWASFPEETIARAYTGHHQIVNAIASCKGGDQFARQHHGLHAGIRKHCVPYFAENATTPSGVEMVESLDPSTMEMTTQLKYPKPNMDEESTGGITLSNLSLQELTVLHDNLPPGTELWNRVSAACAAIALGIQFDSEDEEEEEDAAGE
jgi:hypothetical protein